jgi:hypothetical protein
LNVDTYAVKAGDFFNESELGSSEK